MGNSISVCSCICTGISKIYSIHACHEYGHTENREAGTVHYLQGRKHLNLHFQTTENLDASVCNPIYNFKICQLLYSTYSIMVYDNYVQLSSALSTTNNPTSLVRSPLCLFNLNALVVSPLPPGVTLS